MREVGCLRRNSMCSPACAMSLCRASTLNRTPIIQAAYHGVSREGCQPVLHQPTPCSICAKMIVERRHHWYLLPVRLFG